jgi:probable HAF family extracellular repeat protein
MKLSLILIKLLSILSITVYSSASAVELTDFGNHGEYWALSNSINDSGQVTTSYGTDNEFFELYLFQNGIMTNLYPFGSQRGEGGAINELGQIASGVIGGGGTTFDPAIYDTHTQTITVIGTLGGRISGSSGFASAINNLGEVVGYGYVPNGTWHPFLYSGGTTTDLGCLPGATVPCYAAAYGINDSGQIVGYGYVGDESHAFFYSNGVMVQIDPPGYTAQAWGINNSGQAVGGLYNTAFMSRAFIFQGGQLTIIPPGNSIYMAALAINDSGTVVGVMYVPKRPGCRSCEYEGHAFIYKHGTIKDLNHYVHSELTLYAGTAINNFDQIVGIAVAGDQYHAFMLDLRPPHPILPHR